MLLNLGAHKFQEGDFFPRTTQFSAEVLGWLGAILSDLVSGPAPSSPALASVSRPELQS